MSTIQPLAAAQSPLAGAIPVGVPAGEGVISENQDFASTLSGLLADYLQAGGDQTEILAQGDNASVLPGDELAALAFALDADGQWLSGLDGTELPQAPLPEVVAEDELLALAEAGDAAALLTSVDVAPVVDDLTPVAVPVTPAPVVQNDIEVGEGDLFQSKSQQPGADRLGLQAQLGQRSSQDGDGLDQPTDFLRNNAALAASALAEKRLSDPVVNLADGTAKSPSGLNGFATTTDSAAITVFAGAPAAVAAPAAASANQLPPIATSPHQPGFENELGERILWMSKNHLPAAEIRLNPAHLGPVEARITVTNDQVSVMLTAHHSTTRDALELALPRLREMFADAGITLSDANVAGQSSQQQGGASEQRADRQGYSYQSGTPTSDTGEAGEANVSPIVASGAGMLDVFA